MSLNSYYSASGEHNLPYFRTVQQDNNRQDMFHSLEMRLKLLKHATSQYGCSQYLTGEDYKYLLMFVGRRL